MSYRQCLYFEIYIYKCLLHYENTPTCDILQFFRAVKLKNTNNFLIFGQNIDCGYTLELPQQSNVSAKPRPCSAYQWPDNVKMYM